MKEKNISRPRLREFSLYVIAVCLSLLIAFLLLKLKRADWRVPFIYHGDAMFYSMIIKGMRDNGWHLTNGFIGMPWGTNLRDFPIPDNFHLLMLKLATVFTADHALILNLFFVLTFPLTTITAFYVFRRFQISVFPALLGSLLYTFTPFHLSRSENHLMYSAYYVVPLIVLVILWVCAASGNDAREDQQQMRLSFRNPKLIFSLIVCLLIASTGGVYYSFFACYLLLIVGIVQSITLKHIRHFVLPGVLIFVIFATMAANLSPSIFYQHKYGKTDTATRVASEAETYGLKIAQLLLPLSGHRVAFLAQLKDGYNYNPLVTENDDSTLGLIGSIGFLTLLGWLLARGLNITRHEGDAVGRLLSHLSVLNISALLLGTIGGFSALFALLISPNIRAFNRISVYVSFFAFFAVALLLDRASRRYFLKRGLPLAFGVMVILLTTFGVLDQSSKRFVPNYVAVQPEYLNDAKFISSIEASLPAGAMIFQFPVKRFPETGPIERVSDYDLFKGYLHSKQLRWSYGAMRGREGDVWQASIIAKPIPEMIEAIAFTGFEGIYIDRFGYADNAAKLEKELGSILGASPLVSQNERLSFFNLSAYQQKLREKFSARELAAKREEALYPLLATWSGGFSGSEGTPGDEWRWCGPTGELTLDNQALRRRRVTLEMSFATATEGNLRIDSQFFSEQLKTYPEPRPYSKTIEIPNGKHMIKFSSDAQRVYAPNDPRVLVFRVINFKLKSAE
jgi:phosphoglycerol transferase